MTNLTIIANITAEPDQVDLVRDELHKLIEPTRAEAGCVQYDLHQDNENPASFLFFEIWESRELWQQHLASAHIEAMKHATEGALAGRVIQEMTQIG